MIPKNLIKIFNSLLFFILYITVSGQSSFEFTFQTTYDEEIMDGIQDSFGNYILCGRQGNYMQEYNPLIMKVDKNGNYSTRIISSPDTVGYFNLVTQTPDGNYMFFGQYSLSPDNTYNYLWIVKTDSNLNTMFEKSYYIANTTYNNCNLHRLYVDRDSNYCVAGKLNNISGTHENSDLWMIKFNHAGDTLMTKTHNYSSNQWAQELSQIPETNEYMVIGGSFDGSTSDVELFLMDSLFNKTGFTNVPKSYPNKYIGGPQASSDIWINDTMFLMSTSVLDTIGKRANDGSLGVFKVDTSGFLYDHLILGKPDTNEYAAHKNSMASVNDSTIFLGSYTIQVSFWSENPNLIELYLIDTSLSLLGYKDYGYDAYYWLQGIIPTSDEGCLIYASRYDHSVNIYERDVHIIKMQKTDMDIITNASNQNRTPVSLLAYPNPVKECLTIELEEPKRIVQVFAIDIEGNKTLLDFVQITSNLKVIKMQNLASGLYILQLINTESEIVSLKILKK